VNVRRSGARPQPHGFWHFRRQQPISQTTTAVFEHETAISTHSMTLFTLCAWRNGLQSVCGRALMALFCELYLSQAYEEVVNLAKWRMSTAPKIWRHWLKFTPWVSRGDGSNGILFAQHVYIPTVLYSYSSVKHFLKTFLNILLKSFLKLEQATRPNEKPFSEERNADSEPCSSLTGLCTLFLEATTRLDRFIHTGQYGADIGSSGPCGKGRHWRPKLI